MGLFGTSGIRGRVGEAITIELFRDIGRAVGAEYEDCVVGHDPRTSSEMLECALVSGLLSAGRDCLLAGMVSTPTLAWAGRNHACGAMITASHNPPEYNGVKLWNPNGLSFVSVQRAGIEERIERGSFVKMTWDRAGRIDVLENAITEHIDSILGHVPESTARVVIDCGGGATSEISP
ncbi:MAG: phosphoglucosamine mutase, partial [Candidatus Thermoplasmatota archaeon]|nr:phosphoglucosamine mutase [Candidatus Thermoplasmatota archaeon]